jgi:hypothetical protein
MGIWCFDLDGTITSTPALMATLMKGLREDGHQVHVVSGTHHDPATKEDWTNKKALLESLALDPGIHYDKLVAVSGPEKMVAQRKVEYMTHIGADGLVDNAKPNIKAARKAGFLGLLHVAPK